MSRTFTHHEEQERDDDAPGYDADDGEGLHAEQVEAAAPVDALQAAAEILQTIDVNEEPGRQHALKHATAQR